MKTIEVLLISVVMLYLIVLSWTAFNEQTEQSVQPPAPIKCECKCEIPKCPPTKTEYNLKAEGGGATICCDGCKADQDGNMECETF